MAIKLGASSYSWQLSYYLGQMTLEDCIAHLSSIGGTGFELIPEQMLPGDNFMRLDPGFVETWFEWMEKYRMAPTCLDHFDDFNLYKNRTLTCQEQLDLSENYLLIAQKLGFGSIRVLSTTPFDVLEKMIPMAEHYGVKLGLEIHAPLSMKSDWARKWQEMIARTGTKFAGFIPDFGIFCKQPPLIFTNNLINQGARREIVDYIVDCYSKIQLERIRSSDGAKSVNSLMDISEDILALEEDARAKGATDLELSIFRIRNIYDNPQWIVDVLPLIVHVHAKFYNMVDNGSGGYTDPSVDTERVVRLLRDHGYDGYLSSEYEGPFYSLLFGGHDSLDALEEKEAVRRHHAMLRSVLEE